MKRWLSLLLVAVLLLTCGGCDSDDSDSRRDRYDDDDEFGIHFNTTASELPSYSYEPAVTTTTTTTTRYSAPTFYVPSFGTYPPYTGTRTSTTRYTTSTATTSTTKPSDSYPRFSSLTALRDYMNSQKDADVLKLTFEYTGRETLTAQLMAQMTNACYVSFTRSGNVYTGTLTEYPGDRIVDAYFSGDSSKLNSAEKTAMNKAVQMVNEAKAKAANNFELEVLLHDALCDMITYDDRTREISDPNDLPRNLTVIGALLDGKANCQGYSDAFYTLASIAGFTVSRMSVYSASDLHMTNTIHLNGRWYVVDLTYDDTNNDERNYRLFNAGVDLIREYTWDAEKEIHPIAKTSDSVYYYHYTNSAYTSMQTMVDAIVTAWSQNGQTKVRAMLKNNTNTDAFNDMLKSALNKTGKKYSYEYRYYKNGRDTFYTVTFK